MSIPKRAPLTNRVHRPTFLNHTPRWLKEQHAKRMAKRVPDPVISALYRSPQWRHLRAMVLARCGYQCQWPRCAARATIADHIRPHHGEQSLFFDPDNLQGLCKPCHDRKTTRHDGGFGNPRTVDP